MNEFERKERELQQELDKVRRQKEAAQKHEDSLSLAFGKYFKLINYRYQSTAVSHSFLHVLAVSTERHWKGYIEIDRVDFDIDRSRWELKGGEVVFHNPRAKTAVKARNRSFDLGSNLYKYDKIQPDQVSQDKEGKVTIRHGSSTFYQECSKEEYDTFVAAVNKGCEAFITVYDEELGNPTQTENLTIVELKAISDLAAKLDKGVTLGSLTKVAKKVAKFNYFDKHNQLPELVQYERNGDKGLNLDIIGGDGGTDYEPYVTHYYIGSVSIDWAQILYPIRTLIKGKVLDLVAKLEDLDEVYHASSWEVDYDDSGYDASFNKVSLRKNVLNEVNKLIKGNLK